jgi:hypothetical protein
MSKSITAAAVILTGVLAIIPRALAAGPQRINVYVECHCEDAVGQKFCSTFKDDIDHSDDYRLVVNTSTGDGVGVHFSSVDMFKGIQEDLAGHMSAVSVAFTIYSDRLPGEIFADTTVFRVGQDKSGEMSNKILDAVGQIVKLNENVFKNIESTPAGGAVKTPESSNTMVPLPESSP